MRRQRRYKACDPFAKNTKKVNEPIFDLAPKKGQTGFEDDHFKESKRFLERKAGIERAMAVGKQGGGGGGGQMMNFFPTEEPKPKKEKKKKNDDKNEGKKPMEKLPGESKKEFFRRLDAQVNDAINTTMMDNRTLRKKRKLHLKARDEKKKKMKKGNHDEQVTWCGVSACVSVCSCLLVRVGV